MITRNCLIPQRWIKFNSKFRIAHTEMATQFFKMHLLKPLREPHLKPVREVPKMRYMKAQIHT